MLDKEKKNITQLDRKKVNILQQNFMVNQLNLFSYLNYYIELVS